MKPIALSFISIKGTVKRTGEYLLLSFLFIFTFRTNTNLKNKIIYDYTNPQDYYKAIIDFIAGMTDNYAIDMYNEIVSF